MIGTEKDLKEFYDVQNIVSEVGLGPDGVYGYSTDNFGKYKYEELASGIYDVAWQNIPQYQYGKVVTSGNNTFVDFIYSRPIP